MVTLVAADVVAVDVADAVGNPGVSMNRRRVLKIRATIARVPEHLQDPQVTFYRGS